MRNNGKHFKLVILTGLFLTGCVVSNPKFFSKIDTTIDSSYGYTAENPVLIKNKDLYSSIESSYYYISRLRTERGNKLQLIQRYSIENPNYKKTGYCFGKSLYWRTAKLWFRTNSRLIYSGTR